MATSDIVPAPVPLLGLPRELRDAILANLLLHSTIAIECGIVSIPKYREVDLAHGRAPLMFSQIGPLGNFPLRRPCVGRGTWTVPLSDMTFDAEVYVGYEGTGELPPSTKSRDVPVGMTYQLEAKSESIDLAIMLVCKQLYQDACEMFYGRNVFSFRADFRIPSALRFFEVRLNITADELLLIVVRAWVGSFIYRPIASQVYDSILFRNWISSAEPTPSPR